MELKSLTLNGTTYDSFPDNSAVKTVNGTAPDENGNVEITIPDSSQNANVYIGSDQPTDGTLYWLDTSGDSTEGETEPVVYSVTTNLTNVTIDNTAETVNEGESYAAAITAADGYALSAVSVTMGGVDITGTNYADGNIFIASVTGDVVITAVAVENTATMYSITNNLVGATSNNAAVSVAENDAYTATITVTEGYILDTVTVTMGGVDVTADVYADGVITIPAVTGDVVITVVAQEDNGVYNIVDVATNTYAGVEAATAKTTWTTEEEIVSQFITNNNATVYRLAGVSAGDTLTTVKNNAATNLFVCLYTDGTCKSFGHGDSEITKGSFVDNYSGMLYTFSVPADCVAVYVTAFTERLAVDKTRAQWIKGVK